MKTIKPSEAWFAFKSIRCDNKNLRIRLKELPIRPHPAKNGKYVPIPGGPEYRFDENGHKRIRINVHCICDGSGDIDAVNNWLSGEGWLVFGDEPARAYKAQITEEFSRSNLYNALTAQDFTIPFNCEPYRYNSDPTFDNITLRKLGGTLTSSIEVSNPGTLKALPLIKVSGGGEGTVRIGVPPTDLSGGTELAFAGLVPAKPVYVDCTAKIAYTGEGTDDDPYVLANHLVSGEWPEIPTGITYAVISGDIDEIKITPNWRWL